MSYFAKGDPSSLAVLTVIGLLTAAGLFLSGNANIQGQANVGSLHVTSTVEVLGNTTLATTTASALSVTGPSTSTFAGPVSSTRLFIEGGSAAFPGMSFYNNAGFYLVNNLPAVTVNGTVRMSWGSSITTNSPIAPITDNNLDIGTTALRFNDGFFGGFVSSTRFVASTGTLAAPAYMIETGGTPMGLYTSAASTLCLTVNGICPLLIEGGTTAVTIGSNLRPSGDNTVDFGSLARSWKDGYFDGVVSSTTFQAGDGSPTAPSYGFGSDSDTGLYHGSANLLSFAAGGGTYLTVGVGAVTLNGSALLPTSDLNSAYTIGSATKRFFTGYFGTVSTTNLIVSTTTVATAGATNPLCVDVNGLTYIGASQICPLSSLDSKKSLEHIKYGLAEVLGTDFYSFKLKVDDGRTHSGPVADYLEKTMPDLVEYRDGKVNGYDAISMIGVLGQSVKDLNAKNEALEARLTKLESRVGILERLADWIQSLFKK